MAALIFVQRLFPTLKPKNQEEQSGGTTDWPSMICTLEVNKGRLGDFSLHNKNSILEYRAAYSLCVDLGFE